MVMTSTWPAVILWNRTAYTCYSVERLLLYHRSAHVCGSHETLTAHLLVLLPSPTNIFPNATPTSMDDDRDKDPDLLLLAAAGWCSCSSSYALVRQPELPVLDTVHLGPGPWAQRQLLRARAWQAASARPLSAASWAAVGHRSSWTT